MVVPLAPLFLEIKKGLPVSESTSGDVFFSEAFRVERVRKGRLHDLQPQINTSSLSRKSCKDRFGD